MLGRIGNTSDSHGPDVLRSEAEDWIGSKHQEVIWFHVCPRADDYCIDEWPLATHMNRDELKFHIRFECKITFHSNPAQNIAESFIVCTQMWIQSNNRHRHWNFARIIRQRKEEEEEETGKHCCRRWQRPHETRIRGCECVTPHRVYSNVLMPEHMQHDKYWKWREIRTKIRKNNKTEIKVNIDDV